MITPRSFNYSRPPASPLPTSKSSSPRSSSTSSSPSNSSPSSINSRSSLLPASSVLSLSSHFSTRRTGPASRKTHPVCPVPAHRTLHEPKYAHSKTDHSAAQGITESSSAPVLEPTMGKRRDVQHVASLAQASPLKLNTNLSRPTTPSSPVQIPIKSQGETAHPQKRHSSTRRSPRSPQDGHHSGNLSPSLAALLAVTDIPRKRPSQRRTRKTSTPLTVDAIIEDQQVSEKQLSLTLSRDTLDMLLSPPDELDDTYSLTDSQVGSLITTRTISLDSLPSLITSSYPTDTASSIGTPSPGSAISRRSRFSPNRKSLEMVSPPGEVFEDHPLAHLDTMPVDELSLESSPKVVAEAESPRRLESLTPIRSVFKSNLTASLRALRSAAKSFSSLSFPALPPDIVLSRSLLTMDPKVPYTDERRPPVTEDVPSAEMRRYLNPTTSSREPTILPMPSQSSFSASIQMQTYRIRRVQTQSRNDDAVVSPRPSELLPTTPGTPVNRKVSAPTVRQREMRENPDFIRVAVMEMAMRKQGKLDDQKPGRARWALPPRKTSSRAYQVGSDGVPVRWVSETCE